MASAEVSSPDMHEGEEAPDLRARAISGWKEERARAWHLAGLAKLGHAVRRAKEKGRAATGRLTNRPSAQAGRRGRATAWEGKMNGPAQGKWANRPNGKKEEFFFFLKHISKAN